MFLVRSLLVALLSTALRSSVLAGGHPQPPTTLDTEARNEMAAPGFSGQIRDARRVAGFLTDALVLNNVQQHAILAYTIILRQELALAASEAQAALAQQEYLLAMRRVLATSQVQTYAALVERCTGTMQPLLDSLELAAC